MSRLLDCIVAIFLLLLAGPLLLLICLVIKWESPGPVFERQVSIDRNGRRFELLNFRTTEYHQAQPSWARSVTRTGEFLRYSRMERLPQLINVLRGDINLIEIDHTGWFWLVLVTCLSESA
jgi:lipopolysaccharide/colanic/teichoic acid biosynthesis glycosyltransferase